jgi:protein-L-isoaspartate(D-aspartate) O-methyltransferase
MDNLIEELIKDGYLKTPAIIDAFRKIRREDFVRPEDRQAVAINAPLPIGYGQTISQPLTVAFMLEQLQPGEGDKILDVGTGSGWTPALLAHIVGKNGRMYAIEVVPELKKFGEENADKYNFIKKGTLKFFCADGRIGLPQFAPFDKILVSAAAEEIPPEFLKQLKTGGRLVIPVGRQYESQDIIVIDKQEKNKFKEKRFPGFVFVPLVSGGNK